MKEEKKDKPLRIMHIIYGLDAGGIETMVINIFKNIDRNKVSFDFLVTCNSSVEQFYDKKVKELGGRIFKVGDSTNNKILRYFKNRLGIYKCIKNNKYDIVHIQNGQIDKLIDVICCKLLGVKNIIVHAHNDGLNRSAKFYRFRVFMHNLLKPLFNVFATDFFFF